MVNEIIMPYGKIKELRAKTKVSHPTITRALRGKSTSLTCLRIRRVALELGGVEAIYQNRGSIELKE